MQHASSIKEEAKHQATTTTTKANAPANAKRTMAERRTVTASNTDATQKPRSNRTKK
jgi:hypothetical protein